MRSKNLFAFLLVLMTMFFPAWGQKSSTLLKSDPKTQYFLVRQTLQQFHPTNLDPGSGSDRYDLFECEDTYEYTGGSLGEKMDNLGELALLLDIWRADLTAIGYPESLWGPKLNQFENSQLAVLLAGGKSDMEDAAHHAVMADLKNSLNSYRAAGHDSLPTIIVRGGCGSGESMVHIATVPTGGSVSIIPRFFYKLCQTQKVDPDDSEKCDRWREVGNSEVDAISGSYYYRVRWADGRIDKGEVDAAKLRPGDTLTLKEQR